MQIGECVYEALMRNNEFFFHVIADWIEEYKSNHPEAAVYIKRLRTKAIRIRTVIDVVCKFGNRSERKLFCRIDRIVLRMRHRPEREVPDVKELASMAARRKLNRIFRVSISSRARKKPVLSATRKRTVINNDFWYVTAFKSFLAKHYPPLRGLS